MTRYSVVLLAAWTVLAVAIVVCLLPKPAQGRDLSRRQPYAHRRLKDDSKSSSPLTERSPPHRRRPDLPGVVIESARCTDCAKKGREANQSGGRRLRNRRRHPRRRKGSNHDKSSSAASHPRHVPLSSKPTATLLPVLLKGRKLHHGPRHDKGKGQVHVDTSQMPAEPPASDWRPQRDFWDIFRFGETKEKTTKEDTKEETKEETTTDPTTDYPTDSENNTKTDSNTDPKTDANTRTDPKKGTKKDKGSPMHTKKDAKADDKTDSKTDTKTETKTGHKKETKTDDSMDTKTGASTENKMGDKKDAKYIASRPVLTSLEVQRPPEADRLERLLHPNVGLAIRDLVNTMNRVLQNVGNRLVGTGMHYDIMYNYTRHSMMQGSRELLKDIVTVNDGVYDTVLKASLMTKQVYMRAHQHGLSGPSTVSLDQPQMRFPSFREALYRSRNEQSQALSAKSKVDDMMSKCEWQSTRLEQLQDRVEKTYGFKALEDLKTQLTNVLGKLSTDVRRLSSISHPITDTRPAPPPGSLGNAGRNILEGQQLLEKARQSLRTAESNFAGGRRALSGGRGPGAPVELKAGAPERRQALLDMRTRAAELREQARYAERLLRPLISEGRSITGNRSTDAVVLTQTLVVRDRLVTDVKTLHVLLDRLRLLVGDEEELRARCQELEEEQGSGLEPDGEGEGENGSPIDCDVLSEGTGDKPTPVTPEAGGPDTEDFEFVDEVVIGRAPTSSSISRFGQSLKTYILQMKQQCEARLQSATKAKSKTSNMSRRLRAVGDDIARMSVAGTDIKNVRNQLQRQEAELRVLSDKVKAVHSQVESSHNSSQQRALEALARAQRRLQEVQGQSSPGSRGTTARPASSNGADLTAALTKAAEARRAVASLQGESQAVSGECGSVVDRVTSLQANIAQLRQRLHLARLLLASTQVSMQKKGEGFVAVPVEGEPSPPSLLSQTELCLRPAGSSGTVLLVKGNNSMSYHLEMASKKLSLTAYDVKGSAVGSVQSDRELTEDEWYGISVLREGATLSLTVTSSDGQSSTKTGEATTQSLLQPEPASVFIGGGPSDLGLPVKTGTWEGCVGGLHVNGRSLALTRSSSEGDPAVPCASHCSSSQGHPSLVFHGQGFLHLSEDLIRQPVSSVDFFFRTTQHNAFVLALLSTRQRFQLRVLLSEGTIEVETHTRREQTRLISHNNTFSDGKFHRLQILFQDGTFLVVDGKDRQYTAVNKTPDLLSQAAQGVLVGAMVAPDYAFLPSSQGGLDPLIGCVRELKINEREVSPSKILEARGVNFGICSKTSVWATCARFGESSRAYEVAASAQMRAVTVLVSPSARGPLLVFSNEKDYSLQIELDSTGMTLTESVQDNTKTLAWPKDSSLPFLALSVNDDGKSSLTVQAWESQSFTLSYSEGWFYTRSSNPTSLTLGTDMDRTRLLQGDVSQLMVDGKLVNLAAEKQNYGYQGCSRGLPSPGVTPTQEPFTLAC